VKVKARALIWIEYRLVVAQQQRRGRTELSLPGGRVNDHESVLDALTREVLEQTGPEVERNRLIYGFEAIQPVRSHDLELIFLAEPRGVPRLNELQAIDLTAGERRPVRPAILDVIARDAESAWRDTPRWLGSPPRATVVTD
jgi:ADP-ribose pyrophosphatase YjhB (NUDIX family)